MKLTFTLSLLKLTYQGQAFGKPMIKMAQERKLASHAARPISRFEKELRRCGLKRTLMDIKVPTSPKKETVVSVTPST